MDMLQIEEQSTENITISIAVPNDAKEALSIDIPPGSGCIFKLYL